jgi:hypothetical protein
MNTGNRAVGMWTMLQSVLAGMLALIGAEARGEEKPMAATVPAAPAVRLDDWKRPTYKPAELLDQAGPPKGPWTFVAMGDPHIAKDSNHARLTAEFTQIEKQSPVLVLLLGDIATETKRDGIASWEALFDKYGSFFQKRPWFFAVGNHDLQSPGLAEVYEKRIFAGPNTPDGKACYRFDYGEVRFVHFFDNRVVPKWKTYDGTWYKGQEEWVEEQMASFKGKHLVIFSHCPAYSPSKYRDGKTLRAFVDQTFPKYAGKFTITVLCGHTHGYYRTRRGGATHMTICQSHWGADKLMPADQQELVPGDVVGTKTTGAFAVFTVDGPSLKMKCISLGDGKVEDEADLSLGAGDSTAKR